MESGTIASEGEPTSCRVKLSKVDGKFGLAYRAEITGLVVTGILPGYAADTWNHAVDADRRICVGDTIVAFNGVGVNPDSKNPEEAGVHDLLRAMSRAEGMCSFKLLMTGPRWHVSEFSSAEGIDKMHMATERSMTLGLVMPEAHNLLEDELIKGSELRKLTAIQLLIICVMVAIPNALLAGLWSDMGAGFALFSALSPQEMNQAGNAMISLATVMILGMYLVDWHRWQSRLQQAAVAIIVIYVICIGGIIKCRFYPQAPLVITLLHLPLFVGMLRATSLKQVERTSFYRGICLSTFLVGLAMLLLWLLWMSVAAWDGGNQYNDATKAKLVKQSATLYQEFKVQVNGRMRSLNYQWDCGDKSSTDFDVVHGVPRENGYTLTVAERADRANACGSVKTIWFLLWVAPFICVMVDLIIAAFCGINGTMLDMDDTSKVEKALKHFVLTVAVLVLGMWVAASVAGASMRLTGTIFAFCGAGLVILFVWMYFEVGAKLGSTLRQSNIMGTLILLITSDWFRACFLIGFNVLIPTMFMIEVLKQRVRILRKSTLSRTWLTPEATRVLEYLRHWKWLGIFIKANWLVILYWTISIVVAKVTVVFLAWLNELFQKSVPFLWVLVAFFWIGFTLFLLPPVPGPPMYLIAGIIISAQARDIEAVGYGWGIVIACVLSVVLKLVSGMSQYLIGVFMGKSTKVLQMCQVDQVPIRAMESLLMQKGFAMGKIAVLVGGPDWPISVLCGILRVSLLQVSLGTLPVIFISSPCVLAGAFMAGPKSNMTEADKSMWDALANTALAVSAVVQMASGVFAMYYVQDEMSKHAQELAKPRPEHEGVRLLTLAEQDYNVCYAEALEAKTMTRFWVALSWVSVCLMLISLFVFQFMDEACFRSFAIQDKISDPEGLNCSSLGCALVRLVRSDPPVGWGALGLFFLACSLHFAFLRYVDLRARRLLAQKRASGELGHRGPGSAPAAAAAVAAT